MTGHPFGPAGQSRRRFTVLAEEITAPTLPELFAVLQTMVSKAPDLVIHAIRFDEHPDRDHVIALVFYEQGMP